MGFKVIPLKCPICRGDFLAESYQVHRAKLAGRLPTCSKKCEQERRHAAKRDLKWAQDQKRLLQPQTPKESRAS